VTDHKGTPWAVDGERELREPLGWEWHEAFTDVSGPNREAQAGKNRPNQIDPSLRANRVATRRRYEMTRAAGVEPRRAPSRSNPGGSLKLDPSHPEREVRFIGLPIASIAKFSFGSWPVRSSSPRGQR